MFGGGVTHFMLHNDKLYAFSGAWGDEPLKMSLPGLPENYHLERHTYTISMHETLALWFIDSHLRGLALLTHTGKSMVVHEGHPYSIGLTSMKPSASLGILLDIDGGPVDREWVWNDIHPWQLRVLEGSPRPSLLLKLHLLRSRSLLEGKVTEKQLISHPIPALGLQVTLLFKADESGRLSIETYTLNGTWEELDSLKIPENKLISYTIGENVPLVRVSYSPKTVPATISVAQVFIC